MKIGLVLECQKNGPDQQVCEYLIEQLRPGTEVVSVTLTQKKNLIGRCGDAAALLLQETCQRVVIVWDLYPPWRPENPKSEEQCRHDERAGIVRSLKEADVTSANVHLVCISEELEAWLIADNRAIEAAISRPTNSKKPRIREEKNPESVKNPKKVLMRIFRQHTRGYQPHVHALKIVKKLPDFKKIRRCESFVRFALKATDRQL